MAILTSVFNSQRGGESGFRGMGYQSKFIAYLSSEILLEKRKIETVTCEYEDDVKVKEDSKLVYYQVKSRGQNSLPKSEILDSIAHFAVIESTKNERHNEYVLVSKANISKFNDILVRHRFDELDTKIKNQIESLKDIKARKKFLERVFLMKGPPIEEISNLITSSLLKALINRNENYDCFKIKDALLNYIYNMCPGPTNLEDMKIINSGEKEKHVEQYKTITPEIINKIIETNKKPSEKAPLKRVTNSIIFRYNIMSSSLNEEQSRRFHDQIDDYYGCSEGEDRIRYKYLRNFIDYSSKFNIYKDEKILDFLKDQFKNSNDKYIMEECLYILHNLILTSKIDKEVSFMQYVKQEYFPILKDNLESGDERYEYSFYKIEQIIEELKDLVSVGEICELYWKRMVSIIHKIKETGITDNTLWNCINKLNNNKCKIGTVGLKWLRRKDEYYEIKEMIFRELSSSVFL